MPSQKSKNQELALQAMDHFINSLSKRGRILFMILYPITFGSFVMGIAFFVAYIWP